MSEEDRALLKANLKTMKKLFDRLSSCYGTTYFDKITEEVVEEIEAEENK